MLRYSRLPNEQIIKRLKEIIEFESITNWTSGGLDAILFVCEGDMRNAINTLQSAYAGFGCITQDSVMKICDQPSPKMTSSILESCKKGRIDEACLKLQNV